jgi:hypothetical protein
MKNGERKDEEEVARLLAGSSSPTATTSNNITRAPEDPLIDLVELTLAFRCVEPSKSVVMNMHVHAYGGVRISTSRLISEV